MKLPLNLQNINVIDQPFSSSDAIKAIAKNNNVQDKPFYVVDLGDLVRKYQKWVTKLPTIKPFYAVKCNDSPEVLKVLASLGTCFDCSSQGEINKILELDNIEPNRIIFANPTKIVSHIKYCAKVGIDLMTFDNVDELHKIKANHPGAKLVLRLLCPAARAQSSVDGKFGCEESKCRDLILKAIELNLSVVGVSFHVGSGCYESNAFTPSICLARRVFDLAKSVGVNMSVLDLGGGFTASLFEETADEINKCIDKEFGDLKDVEVIAEPGRYFVSAAFTLATTIHSKREDNGKPTKYYINDGVYGSFNIIFFDNTIPSGKPLKPNYSDQLTKCSLWGPTCDSLDLVNKEALLPPMNVGDIIVFNNMGAYALAAAGTFSGFPLPDIHYFIQAKYCSTLINNFQLL